jgi:uncharacterized repeat protein (TIGR02543 family)
MKKVFYLLILILLNTLTPATIYSQTVFSGGTGTENNPYKIGTKADLILMRDYCGNDHKDEHFSLMRDINISEPWEPIGNSDKPFKGYFHGRGNTISGLEQRDGSNISHVGLFGYNEGTIDSLRITGTTIRGGKYVGGLVGYNTGSIIFCHTDITNIEGSSNTAASYVGGLAGYNTGNIQSSSAKGDINALGSDAAYAGGLVGYSTNGEIKNSFVQGAYIRASIYFNNGGEAYSGGLAGMLNSGSVIDCYTTGKPSTFIGTNDLSSLGAVVGYNGGGISNCYYNLDVTPATDMPATGNNSNGTAEGKYTAGMKTRDVYIGWDFNSVWSIGTNAYPDLRRYPLRLASLTVNSPETLTPAFHPDTLNYKVDLDNTKTSITTDATVDNSKFPEASVTGTGTKLSLVEGKTSIPITVTHDGGKLVYTVNVHRAYVMTFDAQGGKFDNGQDKATQTITSGINTLPVPARTGYNFGGWYTGVNGEGDSFDNNTVQNASGVTTLYAKWDAKEYTLNFDAQKGSVSPLNKKVKYGVAVGDLPTPTRSGYSFNKWNVKPDGSDTIYTKDTIYRATSDKTLYAQWVAIDYTLTFDAQEGEVSQKNKTVHYDTPVGTLPKPTRNGYKFEGWNTATNGSGTTYEDKTVYAETSNITLYAQWKLATYTLSFDPQGGTPNPEPVAGLTYGKPIGELPKLDARKNYTFNGWNTKSDGEGTTYTDNAEYNISDDATFYAIWTGDPYTINFNIDYTGGTNPPSKPVNYGSAVGDLGTPTRNGYSFDGWFTEQDGKGTEYTDKTVYKETKDITLYAKWTEKIYTLTFNAMGGSVSPASQPVRYGDQVTLPIPSSRLHYTFEGWNTSEGYTGTNYSGGSLDYNFYEDMTLYAKWKGEKFKITFDAQQGTVDPSSIDAEYGSKIGDLPKPDDRPGYTFHGWWTGINGAAPEYTSNYIIDGNKIFYAYWQSTKYKLRFDSNGGDIVLSDTTRDVTYGEPVRGLPNPGKRDNYTHNGWNTKWDGTGDSYTETTEYKVAGDTKLYAQWKGKPYTLNLDAGSGTVNPTSIPVNYGSAVGTLPGPALSGYTFEGWYTEKDGKGTEYTEETIYNNTSVTELYAKWTEKQYTLTFDAKGGTVDPTSKPVNYGSAVGELPTPAYSGYKFEGWYTEEGIEYTKETIYKNASDIKLLAKWKGNRYTLTFDENGGKFKSGVDNPIPVTYDSVVGDRFPGVDPPAPADQYSFGGWNTNPDGSGEFYDKNTPYKIAADDTGVLYAIWIGRSYKLSFKSEDITIIDKTFMDVHYGSKIGTMPKPLRGGYDFVGWYTKDNSGANSNEYMSDTVYRAKHDTVVYAEWTPRKYMITFDLNYAGSNYDRVISNISFDSLISFKSLGSFPDPKPTLEHYTFQKWTTERNGSGDVVKDAGDRYKWYTDITLYAQWLGDPCTTTFNLNDGSNRTLSSTLIFRYGSQVGTLPQVSRTGYTFNGWFTTPETESQTKLYTETTIHWGTSSTMVLYAQWTAKNYSMIFYPHNGNDSIPIKVTYDEYINPPLDPTRTGYNFQGWFTQSAGGTKYDGAPPYNPYNQTRDTELHAQWKAQSYTLTFDPGAGSIEDKDKSRTIPYDSQIGPLPEPTRTGYIFDGWFTGIGDNSTQYYSTDYYKVVGNTTLHAKWTAKKYTVTFESLQGGKVDSPNTRLLTFGQPIGIWPETKYDYHYLKGWTTGADGSGTLYSNVTDIYLEDGNITLYAQWTGDQYTITFDAAGGGTVSPKSVNYGSPVGVLPEPAHSGHTLEGWYSQEGIKYESAMNYMIAGNTTLYAKWNPNRYKIKFKANYTGGTDPISVDIIYGRIIQPLPVIERYGYTLEWNTAENGTGDNYNLYVGKEYSKADTTILYAKWIPKKYAVTFDARGGSGVESKQIDYNAEIGALPVTTRPGHKFQGWFDENSNQYAATYRVTSTITLYAEWLPFQYTVTFYDQTSDRKISRGPVTYGTSIGILPSVPNDIPARPGYTFRGWYTQNGENKYEDNALYLVEGDITLYSRWANYVLQFNSQGGSAVSDKSVITGQPVGDLSEPVRTGYRFDGWFANINDGNTRYYPGTIYQAEGNTTLYARWTTKEYVITFVTPGGSQAGIGTEYNGLVTFPVPVRPGYTFKNWNTTPEGDGIAYSGTVQYTIDRDIHLYAQWEANSYIIDFDEQGGSPVNEHEVTYDARIGALPKPALTGYTLKGWFTGINGGGIEYASDTVYRVAGATTLYAKWEANSYNLAFNANYAGSVHPVNQSVTYNKEVVTLPVVTRPGYVFKEWNTAQDGSGAKYTVETVYTATNNTVLYAQWTAGSYTISFEANYLDNASKPENPPYQNIVYGAAVGQLPALTHAGYIFMGWNTAENGSGKAYTETTIYTEPGNITLYAQWTGISYMVNFTGQNIDIEAQPVVHGKRIIKPSDPALQGYVFAGWYKDNDLWDFNAPVTGDILLTARWLSSNSELQSLTITQGVLSPEFQPSITDYKVLVSYDVATVSVTGLQRHAGASVTGDITNRTLAVGDNKIRVTVTAEDGVATTIYTLLVTRADHILVPEANLINLTANGRTVTIEGNGLEYVAACGETSFALVLDASPYANVTINNDHQYYKGEVIEMTGDVTTVNIHIVSETGAMKDYVLKANAAIDESRLYYKRWDDIDVVSINANPENNGGFEVRGVRWYHYIDDRNASYAGNKSYIRMKSSKDYAEVQTVQKEGWRRVCGTPMTRSTEKITAYPNPVPSGESLKLELPSQYAGGVLNIYSITGALVKSDIPLPSSVNTINVDGLGAGIYLFNITGKDGSRQPVKIIIE